MEMASSRRVVCNDGRRAHLVMMSTHMGNLTLKPGYQGQGGHKATRLTRAGLTPSQIYSRPEIKNMSSPSPRLTIASLLVFYARQSSAHRPSHRPLEACRGLAQLLDKDWP